MTRHQICYFSPNVLSSRLTVTCNCGWFWKADSADEAERAAEEHTAEANEDLAGPVYGGLR